MKTLKDISKYVPFESFIFWKYVDCWQKYCSKLEHDEWFVGEIDCNPIE